MEKVQTGYSRGNGWTNSRALESYARGLHFKSCQTHTFTSLSLDTIKPNF